MAIRIVSSLHRDLVHRFIKPTGQTEVRVAIELHRARHYFGDRMLMCGLTFCCLLSRANSISTLKYIAMLLFCSLLYRLTCFVT